MNAVNELILHSSQQPGMVSIDNLEELKLALSRLLARYDGLVYTEAMLPDAKADKKELTRLRKEIDDRRKEVKRAYLAPYNEFEAQVKELLAMIDAPLEEIKAFVSAFEQRDKEAKQTEIANYFRKKGASLGALADSVWNSPAFFDNKWLNKSTKATVWQAAVDQKIEQAHRDLSSIQKAGGDASSALIAKYLETMDMDQVLEYRQLIQTTKTAQSGTTTEPGTTTEDIRSGYKVLKITGTHEQMSQAIELLSLLGLEIDELEDNMPQDMPELLQPTFDSFVAFDIETSGTYGAANGDGPAEITEIGAVKVVDGIITEKFSTLVNPGRKILPRIARITHITDDMVANEPGIDVVIREFADFVGDSILVGHNIRASDLYYIQRAARKNGVRIENAFFDTYRYAKKIKDQMGWENVKLEYLSKQFGVSQMEAHRAWCDAEANVAVYFKLKQLG